jgi:hypothetical protein
MSVTVTGNALAFIGPRGNLNTFKSGTAHRIRAKF